MKKQDQSNDDAGVELIAVPPPEVPPAVRSAPQPCRKSLEPRKSISTVNDVTTLVQSGATLLEVRDLCDFAGVRYHITGAKPPAILLRHGGGHARGKLTTGRECFAVDDTSLPTENPERSLRVLEILARGFDCYQACESICDRDLFSPDISYLVNGRVTLEALTHAKTRMTKKQQAAREFPRGWQTAKRRQTALRYFELFLADNRVPIAQAYHQIRWIGHEHERLLAFCTKLPIRIPPAADWDDSLQFELDTRRDAAGQYLMSIRTLASTSALTLTFTLDAALELLRSDLGCERKDMNPGNSVIAGRSLFELIRAGSTWARHHREWESGPGRTKPLNWTESVLNDLGLLIPSPGELGTLEEMYLLLPFPTWLDCERRFCAEAERLVGRHIV